jgi:hypothetical protein
MKERARFYRSTKNDKIEKKKKLPPPPLNKEKEE